MATQRLGKGLSALIPDLSEEDVDRKDKLTEILVSQISPNPFQPRLEFDADALKELKQSISENGVITPITVRPHNNGYQLIAGERRLRAVQELGLRTIPAFVLDVKTDAQMLEMSLVENIQRENLNPIEEALGYQRLIDECQLTQEQVAQKVGKDRATVANFLRLLKLPDQIQESLRKGEISAGHARALLGASNREKQIQLWKDILKKGLNVRQVERLASQEGKHKKKKKSREAELPYEVREAEDKLRQIFGTQVRIHLQGKGKGGRIELEFYSENDLERLVDMMMKLW
ncbi:MAG: ParB/RepB/Spo0J family partition protein [candidate division KSB1 bacterium]|nr:ParB/RepB/Spo0J family partition protein [candidate division KSB1 bacterium]MDQ7064593.1 ParB/RepB/Spo0J family partition protein [candidate division KSB1 bacterium]